MRWNKRDKVERPEYPKLVALAASAEEARDLLPQLLEKDADAEIVSAGDRGVYVRVHNEAAETATKQYSESRNFPLA
jgi:hypothetical protein